MLKIITVQCLLGRLYLVSLSLALVRQLRHNGIYDLVSQIIHASLYACILYSQNIPVRLSGSLFLRRFVVTFAVVQVWLFTVKRTTLVIAV